MGLSRAIGLSSQQPQSDVSAAKPGSTSSTSPSSISVAKSTLSNQLAPTRSSGATSFQDRVNSQPLQRSPLESPVVQQLHAEGLLRLAGQRPAQDGESASTSSSLRMSVGTKDSVPTGQSRPGVVPQGQTVRRSPGVVSREIPVSSSSGAGIRLGSRPLNLSATSNAPTGLAAASSVGSNGRIVGAGDMAGSPVGSTDTSGFVDTIAYESRIANMENSVKSFDRMLKDYKPPNVESQQVLMQCEALAAQIAVHRQDRRSLEEKAANLHKLLKHERDEREAWLVAFLTSLHATLQELTGCIDNSISESQKLMQKSMNGTDEVMEHLIDRVDQLLIQKESELAPLMEEAFDGEMVS